jgi:molybdate transport system substrate-binding protein
MPKHTNETNRRGFLTGVAGAAFSAVLPFRRALSAKTTKRALQVWSCGGLAEAFIPANNY